MSDRFSALKPAWPSCFPALFSGLVTCLFAGLVASTPSALAVEFPLLKPISNFGSNPGELRMWAYLPEGLPAKAPLVVALHGCQQTAQIYAEGSGWLELAQKYKFALLLPEQDKANNPYQCFNWGGDPGTDQTDMNACDATRDCGENLSVRQMLDHLQQKAQLDPQRTFVTGLSAGAAFSNVLLAAYPERFAGGALIAGLPYGCNLTTEGKLSATQAYLCMSTGVQKSESEWAERVKRSGFQAPPDFRWPPVQVWHGSADTTVTPLMQQELVKQWAGLHGITATPSQVNKGAHNSYFTEVYENAAGEAVIESFHLLGLGHALPVDPDGNGGYACGKAGPFIEDTAVCASWVMARRWGLVP